MILSFTSRCRVKEKALNTLINGQNVLLAYEQIPGTGLFTCYVADLNTLMKHPFHIRNPCLLVLAGTVIACFILSIM